MTRFFRRLLCVVASLAAIAAMPNLSRADFIIRATDVITGGTVNASVSTGIVASNADGSGTATLNSTLVGNFTLTIVNTIATTGPGTTAASETINVTYAGPTGASSDKLIIEILGNKFTNPTAPATSTITSNASPSTAGLSANNVTMTSGVLAGNVTALGAAGTTLGGQLGMSTGIGTLGQGIISNVLNPNPAIGAGFSIVNPFSFYQTYTLNNFQNTGTGSISAGTTLAALPEPATVAMALTALPLLGLGALIRRRRRARA